MYGTVAMIRIKPGAEEKLAAIQDRWWHERGAQIEGAICGIVYRMDSDPNQLILVVVFDNKEAYLANATDPDQDRWYREMAEFFEGEPVWHDGEIISYLVNPRSTSG